MKLVRIDETNGELIKLYARGRENVLLRYYEPELGLFIAESPKVIERALDSGYEIQSMLMTDEQYNLETMDGEILKRIFSKVDEMEDLPIYIATEEQVKEITDFSITRGAMALFRRRENKPLTEVLKDVRRIAILDGVTNPTNVGAIFRSAAALHIDALLLTPRCADPLYRRAIRVSMGNVFLIPWTFTEGEDSYVRELKEYGFYVGALALDDDSISIADPVLKRKEKLALVLGNEGHGLSQSTINACDYTVMIPMTEGVDSLNVAAASAVAFWEITRD